MTEWSSLLLQIDVTANLVITVFAALMVVYFIATAIKIIKEYERVVVFRLGRLFGAKGPGVVFVIPIIDRVTKVDLRERFIEVSRQTCITQDNSPVDIDFLIYLKVLDATASIIQVQDFQGASVGIATTTLRAVVGDIRLDELLARREQINNILRTKLDEVTERWGIKVTSVEIREILPPREVQDAMVKQMTAERTRRAMVLEADGTRESAILVAQGDKKSTVLRAEGNRRAEILKAEGFATALDTIYKVAAEVDPKTMTIQYLEALKALGESPATKYIFPMEFTNLLEPLRGFVGKAMKEGSESEGKK